MNPVAIAKPLALLTLLAMLAFAGNSVLTRMAVAGQGMDPLGFAIIRLAAGAMMLGGLWLVRRGVWPERRGRIAGVFGLLTYLFGFSLAYKGLATGAGALILFGMVQITMFSGAVWAAETIPARRWLGAALAFSGLVFLLAPSGDGLSALHAALMALAGIGWGIYSLAGRGQSDALAATAANFTLALPFAALVLLLVPIEALPASGVALALVSGSVTSGLGYALWYHIVPQLGAARAGVVQLTVPVLAAVMGLALLAEGISLRFAVATLMVLLGVIWASR